MPVLRDAPTDTIAAVATLPLLRGVPSSAVSGESRATPRRRLVLAVGAIMLLYVTLETCAATWAAATRDGRAR